MIDAELSLYLNESLDAQQQRYHLPETEYAEKGSEDWKKDLIDDKRNEPNNPFKINEERRAAVVKAIEYAWEGYERYAFGQDDLKPISCSSNNWLRIGATILDSVDLLWITGLKRQYEKSREWISTQLSFDQDVEISTFEATIRGLGGLLSAHGLTGDKVFLDKAEELGKKLLRAFGSDSPFPFPLINLKTGEKRMNSWNGGNFILSEIGSLQMEFLYLSILTHQPDYAKKIMEIYKLLEEASNNNKYYLYIDRSRNWKSPSMTLGGLGDSFYEYLLKMWLLTDKKIPGFKRMWLNSMGPALDMMYTRSGELGFFFQTIFQEKVYSMEHLTCFAGGMFSLGTELNENFKGIAESITQTCVKMYKISETGLSPESVSFHRQDSTISIRNPFYILRPETVESLFYMWRQTHEQKYRDWGWDIFQAIEKNCKIKSGGYSGLKDVNTPGSYDDLQPSFALAETFKYLYLMFEDDSVLSLDQYVFNTEAHPFPIMKNITLGQDYFDMFP